MAEITLDFLGEQMKRMQADLRGVKADVAQLRAEQLRLEADQAAIQAEMAAGFAAMDARFDQAHQTMATNFAILVNAIEGLNKP